MEEFVFNRDECAMPSCKLDGSLYCVCCTHYYCNWHGRDYLKVTTIGTICGDCIHCLILEFKGLQY